MSFTERPLTWKEYHEFRKSMCRPFHGKVDFGSQPRPANEICDYLDESIHELVGEVAETSQIIMEESHRIFDTDERMKVIDECGDIFFCADWVLGLLHPEWIDETDDHVEIIAVDDQDVCDKVRRAHSIAQTDQEFDERIKCVAWCYNEIASSAFYMGIEAGLLCNNFKKLRYRTNKRYRVSDNCARVGAVMAHANMILFLLNARVEDALEVNIAKLTNRYPDQKSAYKAIGVI